MIKQGQKTVQELIQELTKYATRMVQYLDDYSFRRQLIAALRPSLQKEVLCRGITVEFSSMQVLDPEIPIDPRQPRPTSDLLSDILDDL